MTMTRKEFLRSLVGAGVGAVGVAALVGCGDDGGGAAADAPPPSCATNQTVIQGNHGHVMMVAMADIVAGANKTYDIMGTALHTHSVTLTAGQYATLKNGGMVSVTSSSDGTHSHTINVMCTT